MENEILSLSELAERMCVSKRRVQQFAQDGLVRRVAHGRYTIPKFYVNESRDEGLNMAGLEAAIQRDLEKQKQEKKIVRELACLLYTSPSPRDYAASRMPSSA